MSRLNQLLNLRRNAEIDAEIKLRYIDALDREIREIQESDRERRRPRYATSRAAEPDA